VEKCTWENMCPLICDLHSSEAGLVVFYFYLAIFINTILMAVVWMCLGYFDCMAWFSYGGSCSGACGNLS